MSQNQNPSPEAEKRLEIQIDDALSSGSFSNLVLINHSDSEVLLDFIFRPPQGARAQLRSRVILAPRHFKQLLTLLEQSLQHYERQWGEIKLPVAPMAEKTESGGEKGAVEAAPALDIVFDEVVAQGVYANLIMLAHGESEFVIDFIFLQPQAPRAKVRSRILLSDRHAKRLLRAGQENLRYFEKHFGAIAPAPTPPPLSKPSGTFH